MIIISFSNLSSSDLSSIKRVSFSLLVSLLSFYFLNSCASTEKKSPPNPADFPYKPPSHLTPLSARLPKGSREIIYVNISCIPNYAVTDNENSEISSQCPTVARIQDQTKLHIGLKLP